ISNNLSPHVLNKFGLHKAVKSFIGKLNIIDKPKIKYTNNIENQRFAYNTEVVLYRIVCELISNTLQHANANNIYIDILKTDHHINLEYIDDGKGFDMEKDNFVNKGQGFSNIKSRIKSLNGRFNFFTIPNEGVQVKISINIE
ncbi:MAG: sensor histidine kinase, partial [Prolixibacteraceae bacterium]|nr:sensor histidine kinase [Prolixibacteraceae bacterium]